jgi:hypothetical protein
MREIMTAAALLMTLSCFTAAQPQVQVNVSANFSFDELNQYGEWVSVADYGDVWRPYADPAWRPFVYGRWVSSSDGWLWESDEPFGWIVCHYGNWTYDDDWGWVWVPGYDWSPAQVEWHVGETEIGWVPLLPRSRHGHHRSHAQVEWTFCPFDAFADVEIHSRVSFRPQSTVIVRHAPPRVELVRRHARYNVVTITPHKVYVESSHRRFVRVESGHDHHHRVNVPVGPQFRVKSRHPRHTVTVETRQPEPPAVMFKAHTPGVNVTVTSEPHRQHAQPPSQHRTVEVRSRNQGTRVRVESTSSGRHQQGEVRTRVRKKD